MLPREWYHTVSNSSRRVKTERSCLPFDILNYLKQKETNNVWGKVQSIMGNVGVFCHRLCVSKTWKIPKYRRYGINIFMYGLYYRYYASLLVILKVHPIPKKKSRNIVLQDWLEFPQMISFEFDLKLRQIYYSFDTQSGSLHKELIITNIYPFAYVLALSLEI